MNKFAASMGLLAVGASVLHAAESSTLNAQQKTKPWSIQATLRGFYDDNIGAAPANEIESFGVQISPSVAYGFAGEQTSFNVGYEFTARFYDKSRSVLTTDKEDYTHVFNADLSHVFSPRVDMFVSESFVIGQEPDLLRDPASTQPISGDNMRNFANIDFNIEATQLLSFNTGYRNSFYDYDDEGGTALVPSNSGLLDRMEHNLHVDSQWKLGPQTVGIVGYMYSYSDYTGDEFIFPGVVSDFRNSQGHTPYVGAQQTFSPTLSGSLKVGAQHYSYFNDPADASQWSPYLNGSLRYMYQTTTTMDLGITYSRTAANSGGAGGAAFIRDTETAVLSGAVRHQLMSKLFGTATANVQNSEYNAPGSFYDGQSYLYYQFGLDLSYQFNPHFSAHVGYNYDKMESDIPGSDYDRNRVYLGVTAGF